MDPCGCLNWSSPTASDLWDDNLWQSTICVLQTITVTFLEINKMITMTFIEQKHDALEKTQLIKQTWQCPYSTNEEKFTCRCVMLSLKHLHHKLLQDISVSGHALEDCYTIYDVLNRQNIVWFTGLTDSYNIEKTSEFNVPMVSFLIDVLHLNVK